MPRNTSVTLGDHFERFVARQIKTGRFESKSEVVRAAMRLLEEHEKRVATLRQALIEGELSGEAVPYSIADVLTEVRKEAADKPVDA